MPSFDGLLFGPGLAPGGVPARVEIGADAVTVSLPDADPALADAGRMPVSWRLAAADVALRRAGFDERGLEIAWRRGEGAYACHLLDAGAAAGFLEALPSAFSPARAALQAGHARKGARRAIGWTAVAIVVAAPILLLLLFLAFHRTIVDAVAARIPVAAEHRIGEAAFAQISATTRFDDDGQAHAFVERIGRRLTAGSAYRYRFHVAVDDAVNAYAVPGGIVVVNTGLLKATKRPEELAGVLAHEVQHVELRHSLREMIRSAGLSALWALATGDPGGTLAAQGAQQLLGLKFSRDAESEADAAGFDALVRAGVDPSGMAGFFGTLAAQGGAPPALFSTHPPSAGREAALRARLQALPSRTFEPLEPGLRWPPGH
ncbi:MAG: M48 family metallopeptidase [Gammaproteobacteria bacterium]